MESIDFEILLLGYAIDNGPIKIVDLAKGEKIPQEFLDCFYDEETEKHAHNAIFERKAFSNIGMKLHPRHWYCSAVKAAYCGYPLSLENISKAMELGEQGKLATGKKLIQLFCVPKKITDENPSGRIYWYDEPEQWEEFKTYLEYDIIALREIVTRLDSYQIPDFERQNYIIDQIINDNGIAVNTTVAENAIRINDIVTTEVKSELKEITNVDNPGSPAQLKKFLSLLIGKNIKSIAKEELKEISEEVEKGYFDILVPSNESAELFDKVSKHIGDKICIYEFPDPDSDIEIVVRDYNGNSYIEFVRWDSNEKEYVFYNRYSTLNDKEIYLQLSEEVLEGPDIILVNTFEKNDIKDVIRLYRSNSKSSVKKYYSMIQCLCEDGRVHGLFQHYGANRTGRWAGRLVQLQNLPKNKMKDLGFARSLLLNDDVESLKMCYDNVKNVLSELIRTAFVPSSKDKVLGVVDFGAIEARVTAYYADEKWRLDVFKSHGKIYEASASMMFNVPIEEITEGSDLRDKGKIAELALGFGGSLGALMKMGGEAMGLSQYEMKNIVKMWRKKSPNIASMWWQVGEAAVLAVKTGRKIVLDDFRNLTFEYDGNFLMITLISGRKLFYPKARVVPGKFDSEAIKFRGIDQETGAYVWIETYGGKLVENIVQATARDLLAYSMQKLIENSFEIVMHVHDEAVAELERSIAETELERMVSIMESEVPWAKGLPLKAVGYISDFYKK